MFGYLQVWQVTGGVGYLQVWQVTGGVWLSSSVAGDWRCLVIFKCGR